MRIFERARYALFMNCALVGILMILDMILSLGIGDAIFSPWFFVPVYLMSLAIAPLVAKRIKLY